MPKRLFLVDGSNHAFRVLFALPPQHASDGFPTRVLYGFTLLFQKMMRTFRPDYCAVSFDSGKSFRNTLYPAYKGHRPEMPEDLRRQWPWLPQMVEAFGYKCVSKEGFEADDVLGTLARRFASPDLEVYLVTGDKDFCQLVNENIKVHDDRKGETLGPAEAEAWLGVPPHQVIDLLALCGDTSDNIPGVAGIGEKTAAKLLREFGSLDGILAAAADGRIAGKRRDTLLASADDARLSRQLATISTDVPLACELEDLVPRGIDEAPLREMFDRWEFGQVARQLLPHKAAVDPSGYRTAASAADVAAAVEGVRAAGVCGLAVRTTSEDPEKAEILSVSLAWGPPPESVVVIPAALLDEGAWGLLADPGVTKHAHDLKAMLRVLRRKGRTLEGLGDDTRLLDYVLVAHRRTHGLEDLAQRHLGHDLAGVDAQESLLGAESSVAAGEPAHVPLLLVDRLKNRLEEGPSRIYHDIELPLMPVLVRMEEAGIVLDRGALDAVLVDISARVTEAEAECHRLLGRKFKVGSPTEVGKLLFEELSLPTGKKTKTGWSTDSSVLEGLLDVHPLPGAILEWRVLQKLESTYLRKLPTFVAADGRIHTTFQQAVAATGRLASSDPNLQNIPIRTFEGRRIRDCFVPAAGHRFVCADYSQVELRVLAHYSGAESMITSFREGEDIHRRTAAEVMGLSIDEVTSDQRNAAKAINFGLLYGMSAFRLGKDLGIEHEQAQKYMDEYFARIPAISAWIEESKGLCRKNGYVETLFGRRRLIPEIYDKDYGSRHAAEREAVNTRVQGTAADLIKLAMIQVDRALTGRRSRLLLQVHDELLLECPDDEAEEVREIVVREMMGVADLVVPLQVNASIGGNWNEAHG
ncbi:MAG: DNA polymerase I [Deltaproteobacteria bacterium]|nr:DNA polymerase I [Deltaproteobacteria bacterium]